MIGFPRKIYLITNVSNHKIYVGSTHNPDNRFKSHLNLLKRGKHPVEDMQKDFDKNSDAFHFSIVDEIKGFDERHKEYEWMQKLNTMQREYGYNYKDRCWQATKHYFEYMGEKKTIAELSVMSGLNKAILTARLIQLKWDVEKAINTPINKHHTFYTRAKH